MKDSKVTLESLKERDSFNNWAWNKKDSPIGDLSPSEAAWQAWQARSLISCRLIKPCGACADGCQDRTDCRVVDESPHSEVSETGTVVYLSFNDAAKIVEKLEVAKSLTHPAIKDSIIDEALFFFNKCCEVK